MRGRLLLVLLAIAGVLGMHALVASPASASTAHVPHPAHAAVAAESPSADDGAGAPASHGAGHDPADHSGIAHLCLALAAAIFLLAVRRFRLPTSPVALRAPRSRLLVAAERWTRPPPDPVVVLCVSRT